MDGFESGSIEFLTEPLTRREREILTLLGEGLSSREIAERLMLAANTARWYIQQIYAKLGVNSKRQAIARGRALGLLKSPSPLTESLLSPPSSPIPKHNLPAQATHFFGRDGEIKQIKGRLGEYRLVTLTGSGGVGKTRLALRVAEEVQAEFNAGVWFISLATLTDPERVPRQVAESLGLREDPKRSAQEILEAFVRSRQLLLVLDNCEHLLEACAILAESLLVVGSELKILATSREALGLAGEAIFHVPSLPFPKLGQLLPEESLEAYASIQLFTDRARLVVPGYRVTPQNAPALASICQRLDGVPLAIELAAARMSLLTAEQLAGRLTDAFRLLTGGSRTALPRQQTLRATVDWSYGLLDDKERLQLRRLEVFAGGWDLAGAEAVCAGDGIETGEVLDLLGSLVSQSLVDVDRRQGYPPRYRLLETIRLYAREKLVDSGEMHASRQRHLAYFMQLAETAETYFYGPEQEQWIRRLEAEIENFRLALEVGLEEDPQAGLRLCSALLWFWFLKHQKEGRRWLETYIHHAENAIRNAIRGRALARLVLLAWLEPVDETLAQESLEISLEIGDSQGEGWAQAVLGHLAFWYHQDYPSAHIHLETAQAIFEKVHDPIGTTFCYRELSHLAQYQGDVDRQLAYWEKILALTREKGDRFWIINSLLMSGRCRAIVLGDLRPGLASIEEALALNQQFAIENFKPFYTLAEIYCWLGDHQRAEQAVEANYQIQRNSPNEDDVVLAPLAVGMFTCWQGQLEAGTTILEQSFRTLKESTSLRYTISHQQTFLLELAYAWACLEQVERAQSLVDEYWPLFHEDTYQPRLRKLVGFLALGKGETQQALGYYCESLAYAQKLGYRLDALLALEGYAWSLGLNGQRAESVRLLAAAQAFRDWSGAVIFPRDRPMYDRVIAELKAGLGEAAYASAWTEGQALGFDPAIAQVLAASSPER